MLPVYLHGLAVKNFRGIDDQYQQAAGFGRFSFFIGPNNAGKSTMLDLIHRYLPIGQGKRGQTIARVTSALDHNRSSNAGEFRIRLAAPVARILEIIAEGSEIARDARLMNYADTIVQWMAEDGFIWIENAPSSNEAVSWASDQDPWQLSSKIPQSDLGRFWSTFLRKTGGGPELWCNEIVRKISAMANFSMPEIHLIPAFRKIGPVVDELSETSGAGLIDRLAQLQNPSLENRRDTKVFSKINEFVREVTNSPDATIEIPYSREHILVHMDGRILPLESLGTGIHQVVMLASFCTVYDERIICLEEPELHLHPLLQRRLMEYLEKNTKNQYLIATHSAAFIDMAGASIYRVWQEDGATRISRAVSKQQKFEICADLGHRASDILQSNAIIWVEGPSDRIYLNHWIAAAAPELEEGLHYSTMFYGGRLLSHLSADDDEISEFISLRRLNRNLAIVIDSDKKSAQSHINETKRRVASELGEAGFAWITKGREIENYVPHEKLHDVIRSISPRYRRAREDNQFGRALHYYRTGSSRGREEELVEKVDKVRVARDVCKDAADLSVLDLRQQIDSLVKFIRKANGIDAD